MTDAPELVVLCDELADGCGAGAFDAEAEAAGCGAVPPVLPVAVALALADADAFGKGSLEAAGDALDSTAGAANPAVATAALCPS